MAQTNSEQYREKAQFPDENVDSSHLHGAADGRTEAGRAGEERHAPNPLETLRHREAPTSQVGYGGCGRTANDTPALQKEGNGEQQNEPRYGSVDPNTHPSEAGFGTSGPGCYPEEGHVSGGRPDGAALHSESKFSGPKHEYGNSPQTTAGYTGVPPRTSGYGRDSLDEEGSEVRNGIPHRALPAGVASGAGLSSGVQTPMDSVEQQQYHQTGAPLPLRKNSPYSQQFTEGTGGGKDRFQEDEGIVGNTEGGTAVDHQVKKSLTTKLKEKLPGHKHEGSDSTADNGEGDIIAAPEEGDQEKPGFVTKLKNKVIPSHHKHQDELSPKLYE